MPTYAIVRRVPGTSREELDAAGFRAAVCAYEYPGMRWIRSFWSPQRGEIVCYYDAANEQEIWEHAERARIPCDEVWEVDMMDPADYEAEAEAEAAGTS